MPTTTADRSAKHQLVNQALAKSGTPKTALAVLEACDGSYSLASAEIYKRTGYHIVANTLRNWHRLASVG